MSQALMTVSLVVDQGDEPLSDLNLDDHKVLLNVLRVISSSCHNYPYTNLSRWLVAIRPTSTIGQVSLEVVTVCYGATQGVLPRKTVVFTMGSTMANDIKYIMDNIAMSSCQALNRSLPPNARWED